MGYRKTGDDKSTRNRHREKAEDLVTRTGLPRNMAFQVAMGNLTLSEALNKLAFRDEVEKLIRRYDFQRSLATQIAMGQVSLEDVQRKNRRGVYFAEHNARSILTDSVAESLRITLMIHGQKRLQGRVLEVGAYDFRFQGKGEEVTIHKLQVKAAWDGRRNAAVLSSVKKNQSLAQPCEPVEKPQDRFHCSNRRLFQHMEDSDKLTIHLLEGVTLTGTLAWISKWELGLTLKKGPVVAIFRHAMAELEVHR
ncbi:MAG: sRNA-binding regulator protein Hfq [Myxococcota bacterium]|jgi:sRNA-binding regulator protein Hfq